MFSVCSADPVPPQNSKQPSKEVMTLPKFYNKTWKLRLGEVAPQEGQSADFSQLGAAAQPQSPLPNLSCAEFA